MNEMSKNIYNLDRAREEAEKMKDLVGEKGNKEDYDVAQELVASEQEFKQKSEQQPEQQENNPVSQVHKNKHYRHQEGLKYTLGSKMGEILNKQKNENTENKAESRLNSEFEKEQKLRELIGGQFESVISGTWKTKNEKLSNIGIIKESANSLVVMPYYKNHFNDEIKKSLTFNKNCQLIASDRELREIGVSREDLYDELIEIFENVKFSFYEDIKNSLLPPDSIPWPKGDGSVAEEEIDPRRMNFMENQPRVLFGIAGINSGFRGYYGYVFPNFIVMENNKLGNAAYFIPIEKPIEIDEKRFELDFVKRIKKEERIKFIKENKNIFAGLTKLQVLEFIPGSAKKKHPNREQDEKIWMKKMQLEIDKRLAA